MKQILLIAIICFFAASAKLQGFNADIKNTTVSGLSSGGFMAVQFHFAFSSYIKGAAVHAGGPFWCAQGNMGYALSTCMSSPFMLNVNTLISKANSLSSSGDIDSTSNLADSKVYLYSGSRDTVVKQDVVKAAEKMYSHYGAETKTRYDIPSEHSYVTNDFGSSCAFKGTPYINNCDFDSAWEGLSFIIPGLK